jgi:hypothetical protein
VSLIESDLKIDIRDATGYQYSSNRDNFSEIPKPASELIDISKTVDFGFLLIDVLM